MYRLSLLVIGAVLVGLASFAGVADRFDRLAAPVTATLAEQVGAWLPGTLEAAADVSLENRSLAPIAALLTICLGLLFVRVSCWSGLLLLTVLLAVTGSGIAALDAAGGMAVAPGSLTVAQVTAYGVGLLARLGARADGTSPRVVPPDDAVLMPPLAAHSSAAILTLDDDGLIRSSNPAAARMLGCPGPKLVGTTAAGVFPLIEPRRLLRRAEGTTCELLARRQDGQCFPVLASLGTMEVDGAWWSILAFQDISELKADRELRALHDDTTALPTGMLFHDRIDQAILAAERSSHSVAVIVIHLNLFKTIADTLGPDFGDRLLLEVISRLRGSLRRSDTLARLDSAQLGLLLPGLTKPDIAEAMATTVADEIAKPFAIDDLEVALEANVGIAVHPISGQKRSDLIRRADSAMLTARRSGVPVVSFEDVAETAHSAETRLRDELREAIEEDRLYLEFLPKVDAATLDLSGIEALVRWRHPERGRLLSETLLAVAAERRLVLPLTLRVVSSAIRQQKAWRKQGVDCPIAVNLPVQVLRDPRFPQVLRHVLEAADGRAADLLLEFTETALATDICEGLDALADLGCQLGLDDFGTGSASLTFLRRLPIHELKIDRSFVSSMVRDENAAVIVRSAFSLGESLGLRVVAEGVEDEETLKILRQLGCHEIQGHHVGRPMTADELRDWLSDRRAGADRRSSA